MVLSLPRLDLQVNQMLPATAHIDITCRQFEPLGIHPLVGRVFTGSFSIYFSNTYWYAGIQATSDPAKETLSIYTGGTRYPQASAYLHSQKCDIQFITANQVVSD